MTDARRIHVRAAQQLHDKIPANRHGPDRARTCDLGIKSPLLYQLSYRPAILL